jgi:hypothetical protein
MRSFRIPANAGIHLPSRKLQNESPRRHQTSIPAVAGMSAPVMALYQHGESPCRSMPQTP